MARISCTCYQIPEHLVYHIVRKHNMCLSPLQCQRCRACAYAHPSSGLVRAEHECCIECRRIYKTRLMLYLCYEEIRLPRGVTIADMAANLHAYDLDPISYLQVQIARSKREAIDQLALCAGTTCIYADGSASTPPTRQSSSDLCSPSRLSGRCTILSSRQ